MNEVKLLKEKEILGKDFRVYGTVEEPLFLAKDVAEWINYGRDSRGVLNTSQMLQSVDSDEKVKIYCTLPSTNNFHSPLDMGDASSVYNVHKPLGMGGVEGATNRIFLTEDGLYEVLMLSRKPIAKQFKKQIKNVLKDIRKYGGYLTDSKIEEVLTNPDTIIALATQLKEERAEKARLELQVKESKPKLEYHDNVLQSDSCVSTTVIAKELGMSAIELNKKLHNNGIQYKVGTTWVLYSKYQDKGLTDTYTISFTTPSGYIKSRIQTVWTEKGRKFIHELMSSPFKKQDNSNLIEKFREFY